MKMITLILALFISMSHLRAQSLEPGIWKGKVAFKINGIELPPNADEDCILPHEAKDVKASITKNLKKKGCTIDKWNVKNQNLDVTLSCKNDDLDAKGNLNGQFSQKNYTLAGEVEGTFKKMLPAKAHVELKGEWIKACYK